MSNDPLAEAWTRFQEAWTKFHAAFPDSFPYSLHGLDYSELLEVKEDLESLKRLEGPLLIDIPAEILFDAFVREYRPRLVKFVRHAARVDDLPESSLDGEGVVQDSFEAAFKSWATIDKPHKWIFRVAARKVRYQSRREWFRERTLRYHLGQVCAAASGPNPTHTYAEANEIISKILALPTNQRIATYLRHVEQWTGAEIAELLSTEKATVSIATANTHIHRGTHAVREKVMDRVGSTLRGICGILIAVPVGWVVAHLTAGSGDSTSHALSAFWKDTPARKEVPPGRVVRSVTDVCMAIWRFGPARRLVTAGLERRSRTTTVAILLVLGYLVFFVATAPGGPVSGLHLLGDFLVPLGFAIALGGLFAAVRWAFKRVAKLVRRLENTQRPPRPPQDAALVRHRSPQGRSGAREQRTFGQAAVSQVTDARSTEHTGRKSRYCIGCKTWHLVGSPCHCPRELRRKRQQQERQPRC